MNKESRAQMPYSTASLKATESTAAEYYYNCGCLGGLLAVDSCWKRLV